MKNGKILLFVVCALFALNQSPITAEEDTKEAQEQRKKANAAADAKLRATAIPSQPVTNPQLKKTGPSTAPPKKYNKAKTQKSVLIQPPTSGEHKGDAI
jgi:hypothetical protein